MTPTAAQPKTSVVTIPDLGRVGIWTRGFDMMSPGELADTVGELDELGFATARYQADGAHPYLTLPEHTARARDILGPDKLPAAEVSCVLTEDVEVWRQRAHTYLDLYTGLPNYVQNWKRLGFTDDDAVRGGSDRLKALLVCRGLEETLKAMREHHAAGADHVCIQVLGESTFSAPRADW